MYDDAQDAVAAEYVLGTLSADEREHAEALLAIDPGFAEAVRLWERRLGELNVMVEAVEPPAELWDKIKKEIAAMAPQAFGRDESEAAFLAATAPVPGDPLASSIAALPVEAPASPSPAAAPGATAASDLADEMKDALSPVSVLASSISQPSAEPTAASADEAAEAFATLFSKSMDEAFTAQPAPVEEPDIATPKVERSAEVIQLARRVRRWRRMTALTGAVAALLAAFVVVSMLAPGLIPGRQAPPQVVAQSQQPARLSAQLVAVLQQEPTGPAFLLTVDRASRMLVVRRVSANPEPDRSYELWLISPRFPAPRSLGLVGADEFTQRALPGVYDVDTLRRASYAISLEPAGGSKSGAPTGPILFTGKMVEAIPNQAPPRT